MVCVCVSGKAAEREWRGFFFTFRKKIETFVAMNLLRS